MKRRQLSITRHGAALLGGSVAMIAGGLIIAEGLIMLLGFCGLLLLPCCYFLGKYNLTSLAPTMHMPANVAARRVFELELGIHNQRAFLDAFNLTVNITAPGKSEFSAHAPWTAAGQSSRITLQGVIPGRGSADIHPVTITSGFPLGLFLLRKKTTIRHEITVTPQPIIPLELNSHGSLHDALPQSGLTTGNTFGEPRGIRPWQAGDSARHIHWPASARAMACGHGLRIREYDPPGFHPDQCHIVFHSYATGREMLREDRFERALSLLTGTLCELQGKGIPCVLTADFLDWEPLTCQSRKQLVECLITLAKISRSKGTEAHDLQRILHTTSPDQTLVVISDMTPDSWHHLLGKHPRSLVIDIRQIRYRHRTLHAAI